jgi:hypothetical protein
VRASYRATMTAPDSARASSVYPSPSGRSKASTTTGESRSPWRPQPRLPAQTVLGRPRSGTAPRTPPTVSKPAADRRRRHRARFPHHAGGRALLQPCRRVGIRVPITLAGRIRLVKVQHILSGDTGLAETLAMGSGRKPPVPAVRCRARRGRTPSHMIGRISSGVTSGPRRKTSRAECHTSA